jgi:phosphatidylglycerophosphatase A
MLQKSPSNVVRRIATILATWFGCGYWPVAPGTLASLGALLVAYLIEHYLRWQPVSFGYLAMAFLVPGIWAAHLAAAESGQKDPRLVVIDEVIGQWATLSGATVLNWKSWLAALVLFRLFDIWKPPPVRQLESLPGGAGIVADDVMAGLYAALVLFAAGCFNLY